MWQCIEYKSAAIEQFRKGDVLQRTIDDVASEAANAAEMKAAASGNPLILTQVQLAADLRKLEALYSQHQRAQYRLKDRLKWLKSTDDRLAKAEEAYNENIRLRDANTRTITDNGKEKIKLELGVGDCVLYVKDSEKIKDQLLSGVKEVTRNSSAKVEFGKYRGFEVFVERTGFFSGTDGFRLCIKGADGHEFRPANLAYSFDDKLSLTGLFQRMDNFLAKGLDEWVGSQRKKAFEERGELETVMAAMGKEFPQKEELALVRENHAAVIRELQRMQEDDNYVSTWEPKKLEQSAPAASDTASSSPEPQTLIYQDERGQTEYTASRQFNGYEMEGTVLRKVFRNEHVGAIGQSLYEDGQWHTTADKPAEIKVMQFQDMDSALKMAKEDAIKNGLEVSPLVVNQPTEASSMPRARITP